MYTITRIEIRFVLVPDYEPLNEAMQRRGFTISYDINGNRYFLAKGNYLRFGATAAADLELARAAVAEVGIPVASIYVGLMTETAAIGLQSQPLSEMRPSAAEKGE